MTTLTDIVTVRAGNTSRMSVGTGVFVAEEGGALAGFAMTSEPGVVASGPPRLAVEALSSVFRLGRVRGLPNP
ncbi:hypothetical protein [Prescottella agglutinans]|uniref:hypothetical protein n=1 Tax=Prescottella agglutinans TaxID=1644129 RepID=UPI003D9646EB